MIYLFGVLALFVLNSAKAVAETVVETVEEHLDSWNLYDNLFQKWGQVYGVDPDFLKAIALNESSLGRAPSVERGLEDPHDIEGSKSTDGLSWGLMQVTIKTAEGLDPAATKAKLNDPNYSVKLAAELFAQNQNTFNRSEPRWLEWVVKSYNQGAGNTKKERLGQIQGYAQEYWERFQRNYERVIE